jgi:putative FmdB family regulatory protein
MPTYEYKCPGCGDTIDISHKIDVEIFLHCKVCGEEMKIGFGGGTAIHFKGTGFYETDYKGK